MLGGILIDGIFVGVDVIGGGVVLGLIDGIFVGCLDVWWMDRRQGIVQIIVLQYQQ